MFKDFEENKIKKLSYPNLIYEQIIDSIKDGTLKPGDVLPSEGDFIKQFGVGRTSVREALASLEYLNIITDSNGKYYVNEDVQSYFKKKVLYHYHYSKDEKKRDNVMVVRRILEMQFALLAAQRASANDMKFLRQILAKIGNILDKVPEDNGEDVQNMLATDLMEQFILFHGALATATQNSILVRIFDRFKDLMFFDPESVITLEQFRNYYHMAQHIEKGIKGHDCVRTTAAMGEYLDAVESEYHMKSESDGDV